MFEIYPGITSLVRYITLFSSEPEACQASACPHCGCSRFWKHGCYPRKPDRDDGSLNPVLIQRYICTQCRHTFSLFPECIPPRRWYSWEVQENVLKNFLAGNTIRKISKRNDLARSTVRRWLARLKEQFLLHRDQLRQSELLALDVDDFKSVWQKCLDEMSLSRAMYHFHRAGISIP